MRAIPLCLVCLLLFTGCAQPAGQNPATPQGSLAPYQTATLFPLLSPTPLQTLAVPATPTPFLYIVENGDMLSGLAIRFGVTLESLLAANPGVQPTALTVGTSLVIPTSSTSPAEPAPTPADVPLAQAQCWPETSGGQWCLAVVQNTFSGPLENISLQITLVDTAGQEIASQVAYAPLNILPAGAGMPLGVHFAAPIAQPFDLRVQVLTATRSLPGDGRYLPVMLENTLVETGTTGRWAQVSGRAILADAAARASTLWVLAVAYDQQGNLVGFRRWSASEPLAEGASLPFDLLVSSVGPAIARVEFLSEARP